MKLSLKIRLLRHRAGLDQHQAAEKMNITVAEYSKIESGMVKSEESLLDVLAGLFGTPETELLHDPKQ